MSSLFIVDEPSEFLRKQHKTLIDNYLGKMMCRLKGVKGSVSIHEGFIRIKTGELQSDLKYIKTKPFRGYKFCNRTL